MTKGNGTKPIGDHSHHAMAKLVQSRCGAKTRAGTECRSPPVSGKKRCRMHGGAKGSGAPSSNQNALKHGRYTREALEERRQMMALYRQACAILRELR